MAFIPSQQPDDSSGVRYAKAYKYAFAMLRPGDDLSQVDPNESGANPSSLVTEGRFVSLVLLKEISLREPFATVVTVMQDGGKVVESKGQVIKMGSVSGTTGFLPPGHVSVVRPRVGQLVPDVANLDQQLGSLSGYLAFMKLRYLFRMYGDERRAGNLDVELHWFDYKNDDFWRIEPETFDMVRSSRRPMSYDYNIAFKTIEYSNATIAASYDDDLDLAKILPAVFGNEPPPTKSLSVSGRFGTWKAPPILVTTSRLGEMVSSGLAFLVHCDAVVQHAFQLALDKVNSVVAFFQTVNDAFFSQLNLGLSLLVDASSEIDFLSDTAEELAPDNINHEINEWYLEARKLLDNLGVQLGVIVGPRPQQDVTNTDQRFSQGRMKQGAATDLMQPPAGAAGSPDANPFIGTSGLSLVTNVTQLTTNNQYTTVIVNYGEDIYALARRVLGSIQRFIDLVLLNQLGYPYIVSDAAEKPPNTLAWGDSVLVPTPTSSKTNTTIRASDGSSLVPTTSGTVTTPSLPSELIDTDATWLPDQWVGYTCTATTGGFSQSLIVLSNTDDGHVTLNGNYTITITPGTTTYAITYNVFNPRRPVTPDARAYGTDFLVVYDSDGRADFAIGARGDLAAVSGLDNFIQAVTLRARCPIGFHPFHKDYGMPAPVGRPATDVVFVLNTFFIRRSLLRDPRVGKLRNVQVGLVSDVMTVSAEIQPVDSRIARPISIQVGT